MCVCGHFFFVLCVFVLPEPAYVSNTVSPVVVTVSLLFKGSVFTWERQERSVLALASGEVPSRAHAHALTHPEKRAASPPRPKGASPLCFFVVFFVIISNTTMQNPLKMKNSSDPLTFRWWGACKYITTPYTLWYIFSHGDPKSRKRGTANKKKEKQKITATIPPQQTTDLAQGQTTETHSWCILQYVAPQPWMHTHAPLYHSPWSSGQGAGWCSPTANQPCSVLSCFHLRGCKVGSWWGSDTGLKRSRTSVDHFYKKTFELVKGN